LVAGAIIAIVASLIERGVWKRQKSRSLFMVAKEIDEEVELNKT